MKLVYFFILMIGYFQSSLAWADSGKVHPVLQWFDDKGQIVEVHWRTSTRWIWKATDDADLEPALELWIALPQQVQVSIPEGAPDSSLRIIDAPAGTHEMGLGQILVLEARHRSVTAKLQGATGQEGLLVNFRSTPTRLLVHDSCSKFIHSLKRASVSPVTGPFYIGISCSREKPDLLVHIHPSEGAVLPEATLRIPPGLIEKDPVQTFEVRESEKSEPIRYEIHFKEGPKPEVSAAKAEPKESPEPYAISVGAAPAYLSYPAEGLDPGFRASAYNIDLSARLAPRVNPFWDIEASLPVFSIFPGPFHFPASGVYTLAGNFFPLSWSDGFRFGPGLSIHDVHLEQRWNASGLLLGPQAALAYESEKCPYSFEVSAAPLLGAGRSPFFHSFDVDASFAFELSRNFVFGKRLDLEARFRYFGVQSDDGSTADLTDTSLGLRVKL